MRQQTLESVFLVEKKPQVCVRLCVLFPASLSPRKFVSRTVKLSPWVVEKKAPGKVVGLSKTCRRWYTARL